MLAVILDKKIPFQFHKGAIKTISCISGLDLGEQFQFHKGAIKTNMAGTRTAIR